MRDLGLNPFDPAAFLDSSVKRLTDWASCPLATLVWARPTFDRCWGRYYRTSIQKRTSSSYKVTPFWAAKTRESSLQCVEYFT